MRRRGWFEERPDGVATGAHFLNGTGTNQDRVNSYFIVLKYNIWSKKNNKTCLIIFKGLLCIGTRARCLTYSYL